MKNWRVVLFPFGFLYGIITAIRNLLFDFGIKKSYVIPVKSICVGNLSVGGTGKTPHVAWLTNLLQDQYRIQLLSRGYGRNTKGFILLNDHSTSETVGDEPLFYFKNFPKVQVAVCESRKIGVEKLIHGAIPDVIILDDAFQHRPVKAGFNILLTDFNDPYFSDLMLPAGNLREWKCGRKRADIVIVTKCPANITAEKKSEMRKKLRFHPESIYFSSIKYGALLPFSNNSVMEFQNILLVTGIANPSPLEKHLKQHYNVEMMKFPDHHAFSLEDIQKIHKKFDTFVETSKIIVTTEKDYMRLCNKDFSEQISKKPWFYQQITVEIDRNIELVTTIKDYVRAV